MSHPFKKQSKPGETIKEAIDFMTIAWRLKDFDSAQFYLGTILKGVPLEALEQIMLTDLETSLGFFELFVHTRFDSAPEGSAPWKMYLKIVQYIMENATPELK